MAYDYDVVVIGCGIAGFVSAVTANGLGKRVALVEKRKVGGNCTNFTCIPSKTLIRQAHMNREISRLHASGLAAGSCGAVDTAEIMAHVRSIVRKAREKDLPETFEKIGIEVVEGEASFLDHHHIQLHGEAISSRTFIIAAGTLPVIPAIEGIGDIDYLTNETILELDALPKSLIILGGGVAGMEFASALGRLGVQVTIVETGSRFLAAADREVVKRLLKTLECDGITLLPGTTVERLRRRGDKSVLTLRDNEGRQGEIEAERVLVSVGRKADVEGLRLEKAGVGFTGRGIMTDDKLRTSADNIYACGDVVGPYQLASMAEYQAIVATTNALLPFKRRVDYSNNVYVVYTEPPLAFLGLTEEQAHEKYGHKLKVYRFDYENMRRALTDGMQTGVAKLLCDHNGLIVGAHILGEAASEVIHEIQTIKALHTPLHKLHTVTHAYPTYAQAIVGRASQLAFLDRLGRNVFVDVILRLLPGYDNRLALARERLAESDIREKDNTLRVARQRERQERIHAMPARNDNGVCVVRLPPDLMNHDETPIMGACSCSGITDPKGFALDFSRVNRINGLGAVMLVKLYAKTARQHMTLTAFGLPNGMEQVFRATGLDSVIPTYDGQEAAVSGVKLRKSQQGPSKKERTCLENMRNWAKPIDRLAPLQEELATRNLNVAGRKITGPVAGFGQMREKMFRLRLADHSVSPEMAVEALKQNFGNFQPRYNRFFPSPRGLSPGETVPFDAFTPGGPISTAVVVLYSDETSFTFITPQGHPEAGMVSFSANRVNEITVVQILGVARAGDPLFEAAFLLIGSRLQNRIWCHVLTSLAIHLGVPADITVESRCIDRRRNWSKAGSVWFNAQARTLLTEPIRWPHSLSRRLKWHAPRPRTTANTTLL